MTILSAAALESDPLGCSLLASVIGLNRDKARTPSWSGAKLRHSSSRRRKLRPAVKAYDPFFSPDPVGFGPRRINEFDEGLWEGGARDADEALAGPLG
jgi:hypothetical protein